MRYLLIAITLILSGCSVYSNTTFVPPHNEPIVGDYVARYRQQIEVRARTEHLEYEGLYNAWGLQRWRSDIGHFPESWENSDWSVEGWHYDMEHKLTYWMHPRFGFYTEYFYPLDDKAGDKSRTDYYWLTGVRAKLW